VKLTEVAEIKHPMYDEYKKRAEALAKKMLTMAKKLTSHAKLADVGSQHSDGKIWWVTINSDTQLSDEMADIVKKDDRAILVHKEEHKGQFDWASDTYIKDASSVSFKFTK